MWYWIAAKNIHIKSKSELKANYQASAPNVSAVVYILFLEANWESLPHLMSFLCTKTSFLFMLSPSYDHLTRHSTFVICQSLVDTLSHCTALSLITYSQSIHSYSLQHFIPLFLADTPSSWNNSSPVLHNSITATLLLWTSDPFLFSAGSASFLHSFLTYSSAYDGVARDTVYPTSWPDSPTRTRSDVTQLVQVNLVDMPATHTH